MEDGEVTAISLVVNGTDGERGVILHNNTVANTGTAGEIAQNSGVIQYSDGVTWLDLSFGTMLCRNESGSTITQNSFCELGVDAGNGPLITLADASTSGGAGVNSKILVPTTDILTGTSGVCVFSDQVITGLSGLTAGSTYFIAETAGAITATALSTGSSMRVVGQALTATTLLFSDSNIYIGVP